MGGSLAQPDVPKDYEDANDIPFEPDGKDAPHADAVDYVRGCKGGAFEGKLCARKTLRIPIEEFTSTIENQLRQETRALQNARHKHVVQLFHTYIHRLKPKVHFCIVMDRAESSLAEYLNPNLPDAPLPDLRWFGCLLLAVQHIHGLGIRHRDIKPSNILIQNNQVLLADFGISKMGLGKTMPTTALRNSARSEEYCAPEVDDGSTRGRSADIFSLGATALEMCVAHSGKEELKKLNDILGPSKSKSYAKNIDGVHDWINAFASRLDQGSWQRKVIALCKDMLQPDRHRRPLASDIALPGAQFSCTCEDTVPVTSDSLLLEACKTGDATAVTNLLLKDVNPRLMGAIHLAAGSGSGGIVRALLEEGVEVDSRNQVDQTPLHCASRNGRADVVRLLLDYEPSASVDAIDEDGQTPLHCAAAHDYQAIARMLLNAGADRAAKDSAGKRPRFFANRRKHYAMVDLLDEWDKNKIKMLETGAT